MTENLNIRLNVSTPGVSTASRWSYCEISPLSFSARALFSWHSLVLRLLCSSIWAWISLSVPWKWVVISFLFRSSSLHLCRVSSCRRTSISQQPVVYGLCLSKFKFCRACVFAYFISKVRMCESCQLSVLCLVNKFPRNEKSYFCSKHISVMITFGQRITLFLDRKKYIFCLFKKEKRKTYSSQADDENECTKLTSD